MRRRLARVVCAAASLKSVQRQAPGGMHVRWIATGRGGAQAGHPSLRLFTGARKCSPYRWERGVLFLSLTGQS